MADITYYYDISKTGKDYTGNKDISILTNEQALLESVKNIILTEPGTRVMNPTFGCGLTKYLFEPLDGILISSMKSVITDSIRAFEPRVENLQIFVAENQNDNSVDITMYFNMKTYTNTQVLNLSLQKIR